MDRTRQVSRDSMTQAAWLTTVYLLVGVTWILFSDRIASAYWTDPVEWQWVQLIKGWSYIAITAAGLFFLSWHYLFRNAWEAAVAREAEEKYRELVELSPVGIFLQRHGKFIFANPTTARLLGYSSPEELVGKDVISFVAPEYHELVRGRIASLKEQTGSVPWIEYEYLKADGSRADLRVAASSFYLQGEITAQVVALDVTERNRMFAQIERHAEELELTVAQRTAELREVNAELEAYASTVSHDLRAPLRAVQGFAQALLEDYGPVLGSEGSTYARSLAEAAQRMDGLIQDLLSYSRLSRASLELGEVSLRSVVEEARRQLAAEIESRGAEIFVSEPLPRVRGHWRTLAQVVANLLSNAMKFTAPGEPPRVDIRAEEEGGKARLWVIDRGIGIAPENFERIFRVFERLHGIETYGGTGIGLAIVKKGMERMGGACGVESEPGKGTKFWIELPLARR